MAKIEFLSWRGLRHLVSSLWERIDAIFLRKLDPRVAHLSYDEDSSTLTVDSSIQADRAAFKEIVVGDASEQGEFPYDRIEVEIVDSSNPIMAHAIFDLAVLLKDKLASIDDNINKIWEYLQNTNPMYIASAEELKVLLEAAHADIGVLNEVLGSITDPSQTSVDPLPDSNYWLDPDNDNTLYIKPDQRISGM